MKLTVLMATLNRPSLPFALASCAGADEIILVADGPAAHGASAVLEDSGLPGWCIWLPVAYDDFGHTPRQIGLGYCSGDFIAHLDDDDVYTPGAVEILKSLTRPVPHFFRCEMAHLKKTVWVEPTLELGNITTNCIVHPNDRKWGVWSRRWGGDYEFAASTAANYPAVEWVDHVIAKCEAAGTSPERRAVEDAAPP